MTRDTFTKLFSANANVQNDTKSCNAQANRTRGQVCARPHLEALHPEATVLHLEEELLSQDALKLAQWMLMRPQPQLKSLHITSSNMHVECLHAVKE